MRSQPPDNQQPRAVSHYVNGAANGHYSESKRKPPKNKADSRTIEALFSKFEIIWGRKWEAIEEKHPDLIADEWREALAGLSRQAIQQGLSKTRQSLTWPPSIAEFLQACQGVDVNQAPNTFSCSVPACPDVGSMCSSPWGNNWVCNRHWREGK